MSLTNIDRIEADLNGQDLCIGIVQARFNAPICEALTEACVKELLALGVAEPDIVITMSGSATPRANNSLTQASVKASQMGALKRACTIPMQRS